MNSILSKLKNKKILILGFGREGQSTLSFLRKYFPSHVIHISDKNDLNQLSPDATELVTKDVNVHYFGGVGYLKNLDDYDFVFKTPGIPNKLEEIKKAKKKGVIFSSQTKLFLDICNGKVIGITGTKGKSTTSSLISHILNYCKVKNTLMGNIGKPPLDYLVDDNSMIYVFEMSSHQLADVNKSPQISIFLNIFPEHLDYYEDFRDYLKAKANITKFQKKSDLFIFNGKFNQIKEVAEHSKAITIDFTSEKLPEFTTKLIGVHNGDNIKAAYLACREFGLDKNRILEAVATFDPLTYRLELVKKVDGVEFIDDGLATIPEATNAAIDAVNAQTITLILGGFDRGVDFESLVFKICNSEKVKAVVVTGQVADKIEKLLKKHNYTGNLFNMGKKPMDEIVQKCADTTKSGGAVLLSPAATSFDMYMDYKDRSNHFKASVMKLKQIPN